MCDQKRKKALIIAPHPDDEINLAGQLSVCLRALQYDLYIVYTTNGDAEKKIGNKRLHEAIKAAEMLGIDEAHLIVLGYPNEWKDHIHIYNAPDDSAVLISKLDKTETNSILSHPEYCLARDGVHHKFTRHNFKADYSDLIESLKPDIIIAPEFDSHPDHRAASLLFDEIMGELLKREEGYDPIVLKKYIHEGVWNGPKDYYSIPARSTITSGKRPYSGGLHDLDTPCFTWDERIRFRADPKTVTELLKDNTVYQAAKQHRVTTAWYEMQRVINRDIVYWYRPQNNLALKAEISVTSGNGQFLNDYKYYDTEDVYDTEEPFHNPEVFCWRPELADMDKTVHVRLRNRERIKLIRIYEDCNAENHVTKALIGYDDKVVYEGELKPDGSKTELDLGPGILTDQLYIRILEYSGRPGLSELELYSDDCRTVPLDIGIDCDAEPATHHKSLKQRSEQFSMMVRFLFAFKIKYEIKQIVARCFGNGGADGR